MRIVYFTDTYLPEVNGVTNTLSRLGNYLDNQRIHQLVIASDYETEDSQNDSRYRKIYRFKGIKTSLSPKSRLAMPTFWDIDRICDNFMPDIIHVTTELGIGFRGMRYARSRNIPLVMSYHTDYGKYLKYHNLELTRPLLEAYLSYFYGFSCRTLVPSQHTLGALLKKGFSNLDIWSRGIDSSLFGPEHRNEKLRKSLACDKFIFLYVGRLSAEKSIDLLLDAAEKIESLFPGQTAFMFTGDGPYVKNIKSKKSSNVIFTGFLHGRELSEVYASADCFAFPSSTETFGNVVLEAMASGLPIAAVNSGGVTDFLSHNYNSLLCEPDNKDNFINNLINIMKNNNLRIKLSVNARKSALLHDWNSIFEKLVNTYVEVINENRQDDIKMSA